VLIGNQPANNRPVVPRRSECPELLVASTICCSLVNEKHGVFGMEEYAVDK